MSLILWQFYNSFDPFLLAESNFAETIITRCLFKVLANRISQPAERL